MGLPDPARLFIGLPLSPGARESLWRYARGLEGVRPVPPDMYHITLCFLGLRPRSDMDAIGRILRAAPGDRMELTLGGVGRFRNGDVFWAGLEDPPEALFRLQAFLAESLGMEKEIYRPHITLARKAKVLVVHGEPERVRFSPDRLILYESLREEGRLTYRPRREARLPAVSG